MRSVSKKNGELRDQIKKAITYNSAYSQNNQVDAVVAIFKNKVSDILEDVSSVLDKRSPDYHRVISNIFEIKQEMNSI